MSEFLHVNEVFLWCVQTLEWLAATLGMTYEEVNVWIFCIIWPIVTLWLVIWVATLYWRLSRPVVVILSAEQGVKLAGTIKQGARRLEIRVHQAGTPAGESAPMDGTK